MDGKSDALIMTVTSTEFAHLFGQRSVGITWLLGAGTSASAGIPTGWNMIVDFKTRLFCAATKIPRNEVDPSDPVWLERLTAHFDNANGMPEAGHPSEYSAAFEAVYPTASDRRAYIEEAVRLGSPSYGHRVLASLITDGHVRRLFTTNFDPLIERATTVSDDTVDASRRAHLLVGALDSVERASRALTEDSSAVLVKLHGDYQSDDLKNTDEELQTQDELLRELLVDSARRTGLLVVGYSGRDQSILDALGDIVSRPDALPNGLWWALRPGHRLLPDVSTLLDRADKAGIEARIVETENFDELMGDLEQGVTLSAELRAHIDHQRPSPLVTPVAMPTKTQGSFPVLRCSAIEFATTTRSRDGVRHVRAT